MSRYVPEALRRLVAVRANFRCEYYRLREIDSFFSFQMEHIVSMKHGGLTVAENLALACQICNYNKGSDIATFLNNILTPIRFLIRALIFGMTILKPTNQVKYFLKRQLVKQQLKFSI